MAEVLTKAELVELALRDVDAFQAALPDVRQKRLERLVDKLDEAKLYRATELSYLELLKRNPENEEFHRWLGFNLYFRQREARRAEAFLEQAATKFPDNAEILLTRATNLAWGLGLHEQALPIFQRSVELTPENALYRCCLGWCSLWLGEIEQGLDEIRRSLVCDEDQDDEVRLADHLYLYLFGAPQVRTESLVELRRLVQADTKVEDWDVSRLLSRAIERGHPESEWLGALVAVVGGSEPAATLEGWEAWREAKSAPSKAARALIALHAANQAPPSSSLVQIPQRRDFLARYEAGEYAAWGELVRHSLFVSQHADARAEARAVAEALMRRVRQNVDAVRATLKQAGAKLADEQPPASPQALERLVKSTGPLPVSLAAFWNVVGSIDLLPPYSRDDDDDGYGPCSLEAEGISLIALDPLSVYGPDADRVVDDYDDALEDGDEDEVELMSVPLAPDFLHKQNISGGSSYKVLLPPTNVFDALDPDVLDEAHETTLVGYLRACFEYGGFPLLAVAPRPIEEISLNYRIAFKKVTGPWGPPAERLRERLRRDTIAF